MTYLGMGLSLLSAPLLARELGADGRGVLAAAFVLVQLLSWSAFLGLPRGLAMQELRNGYASRNALRVVTLLGPIAAVIAFIASGAAANGDDRIATYIKVAASVLVLAGLGAVGVERALIRGQLLAVNLSRALNLVLPSLAIIIAFGSGVLTLQSAFVITLSGQMLSVLLGIVLATPLLRSRTRIPAPWRFSLHYWGGSAFDGIGARVDQLILAACVLPNQLGVYAVAVTCASAAGGFTQALNQLTYSRFASLPIGSDDAPMLRKRTFIGLAMSALSGGLIVVVVALWGDWLFGSSFDGLFPIVSVLVIAQAMNDQWQLRTYLDSASGDPSALMWASACGMVVLVAVAVLLGMSGNLSGLSMAWALVGFAAVRLAVRAIIHRTRPAPV
ncbi:oligosaccharide flippase family protein [Curtobacterium sp. HSID17257]|uniref:oligosaccharide flippase family protein n=1 Tax=Curtobacterium sp. HSID17257 TaxID=2419510 RepID=UPI001387299F|nr:oligosaccharide flippase family protein [Curtobacterium sp. HSID17257]